MDFRRYTHRPENKEKTHKINMKNASVPACQNQRLKTVVKKTYQNMLSTINPSTDQLQSITQYIFADHFPAYITEMRENTSIYSIHYILTTNAVN